MHVAVCLPVWSELFCLHCSLRVCQLPDRSRQANQNESLVLQQGLDPSAVKDILEQQIWLLIHFEAELVHCSPHTFPSNSATVFLTSKELPHSLLQWKAERGSAAAGELKLQEVWLYTLLILLSAGALLTSVIGLNPAAEDCFGLNSMKAYIKQSIV